MIMSGEERGGAGVTWEWGEGRGGARFAGGCGEAFSFYVCGRRFYTGSWVIWAYTCKFCVIWRENWVMRKLRLICTFYDWAEFLLISSELWALTGRFRYVAVPREGSKVPFIVLLSVFAGYLNAVRSSRGHS